MTNAAKTIMRATSGCLLLWSFAAIAQSTPDPTRPPDSLSYGSGNVIAASAGPILQSVLISEHSKIAIISGQVVKLNQKFGDFRLVHISETEVILQNGKIQEVLKLFPDIKKQSVNKSVPQKSTSTGLR